MTRRPFTITKLERCAAGYWTARVTCDGQTIEVDRRYGSWQATIGSNGNSHREFVMPHVAEALQEKLPLSERRPKTGSRKKEESNGRTADVS